MKERSAYLVFLVAVAVLGNITVLKAVRPNTKKGNIDNKIVNIKSSFL